MLKQVEVVRGFNRFYTRQIGLLDETLLASEFSLTEVRVLYELAHRERFTAADLARELGLDPGYLSRILRKFTGRGLVRSRRSASDARQWILALTEKGRRAFSPLERASSDEVLGMLEALHPADRAQLVSSMQTIQRTLAGNGERRSSYVLRAPVPGDLGWITHRQGVLYWQEYGWDETFEALVAEIAAAFVKNFKPERERCWIAELDAQVVGSVFLADGGGSTAKLRLLYVEPTARGLGIGSRLVTECVRFARACGYREVSLWTNSVLASARKIYESQGFRRVEEKPHRSFGKELVGETWVLEL